MVTKAKVIPIIPAWSFSRLNDYRKCPQFARYKHVDKIREPGNAAMARGGEIHKLAEKFASAAKRAKVPAELELFKEEFRDLQGRKVMVEEQWAFREDWSVTGWFDKDCWARMVTDAAFFDYDREVLVIIDHKTGKLNEGHLEQLDLYALGGFAQYEEIEKIEVQLWYLDQGVIWPEVPKVYMRSELPSLKKQWEKKVKPMMADRRFSPKPGKSCSWCFFSKAKNGPCQF